MSGVPFAGKSRPSAFTLIEVLVVVAIIALLVAILLPSLMAARRQTYATVCLTNLRQIGIGAVAYAHAYHDYIPPVDPAQKDVGPMNTTSGSWGQYLVGGDDMRVYFPRYGATLKLWVCPGARNTVRTRDDLRGTYDINDANRLGSAYEYNPWMYNIVATPKSWPQYTTSSRPGFQPLRLTTVKFMSRVTIAHDNDNTPLNWYPDGDDPHASMKGGNMLYGDGHASWVWDKNWATQTDGGRPIVRR